MKLSISRQKSIISWFYEWGRKDNELYVDRSEKHRFLAEARDRGILLRLHQSVQGAAARQQGARARVAQQYAADPPDDSVSRVPHTLGLNVDVTWTNSAVHASARGAQIYSFDHQLVQFAPLSGQLWTSTCPSATGSRRLKWSETIWKSKRIRAFLSRSSPTSASSLLNFRQFHKWQRSSQLSMSTKW